MAGRAEKTEVASRVDLIYGLLVQGWHRGQIIQWVTEQTDWGVQERQVEHYIARAREALRERQEVRLEQELSMAIARSDELFRQCLLAKDRETARKVLHDRNQLTGLATSDVVAVLLGRAQEDGPRDLRRLTDDELEALAARAREGAIEVEYETIEEEASNAPAEAPVGLLSRALEEAKKENS